MMVDALLRTSILILGVLCIPAFTETQVEVAISSDGEIHQVENEEPQIFLKSNSTPKCFSYGCPTYPMELNEIQNFLKLVDSGDADLESGFASEMKRFRQNETFSIVTHIGYKGGKIADQINQDRAFIVSPFYPLNNYFVDDNDTNDIHNALLLGVFDGHSKRGEEVSQFVMEELPRRLATKLSSAMNNYDERNGSDIVVNILTETFIELDEDHPTKGSGGCTASVALRLGNNLYIANTGDSTTFIGTYNKQEKKYSVPYVTSDHKPNREDEKARVEKAGGQVYIPNGKGTSRVITIDYKTMRRSGLAMSRSIGDWDFGKNIVIPNPTVDVLKLDDLRRNTAAVMECAANVECTSTGSTSEKEEPLELFLVSATDGMMDELSADELSRYLSAVLFSQDLGDDVTLFDVSHALVEASSARWGRQYRDDIAIAVHKIQI